MIDPLVAFRLDGRTAIVTGASSGLGARFARVLAGAGATVVASARRAERLEALVADLPAAFPVAGDVAAAEDRAALVAAALERTGRLDVLVNNAGITETVPALDEDLDEFRRVVEVNLTATFALSQLAARHMVASGSGVIVNIASVLGLVSAGQIPQAGYAASKAGVVNLTRELAAQWARQGVRVNAICPGWFPSEMTEEMFASEAGRRWLRRKVPMGRGGEEAELDGILLYLASDASSYTTGVSIPVDGGYTAV
jgi:NAD(P)-dependent dehydrogenase (short-subunit alcohol dehydrogenase family)